MVKDRKPLFAGRDRRAKRAHAPLLALEYFLEAERRRTGAAAIGIFIDEEPLVMSSADAQARSALEACVLPGDGTLERDVYLLPLAEGELVLASLDARVRSVREVERSVTRILAA